MHMIAPADHDAYSRVVKLRHAGDRHRGLMGFDDGDPNVLEGKGGAASSTVIINRPFLMQRWALLWISIVRWAILSTTFPALALQYS